MSAREENTNLFVFDERRTEKETNIMAKVGIVMGSDSDMPVMAKAADILEKLGIDYEMTIISCLLYTSWIPKKISYIRS